jgi:hypothetical protein
LSSLLNKAGFNKEVVFKGTVVKWSDGNGYRFEKFGFYTYHSAIGQRLSRTFTNLGEYKLVCGSDEKNSAEVIAQFLQNQGLNVKQVENTLLVSNGNVLQYEKVSVDTGLPEWVTI